MNIQIKRDQDKAMLHRIKIGNYELLTDLSLAEGGEALGPDAHDLFDASLGACKALTLLWYAQRQGIPLEDIAIEISRDDSEEANGKYLLKAEVQVSGPISEEQRKKLVRVVDKCPVQKLMTQAEIRVETRFTQVEQ